jgi:hypothetical protein
LSRKISFALSDGAVARAGSSGKASAWSGGRLNVLDGLEFDGTWVGEHVGRRIFGLSDVILWTDGFFGRIIGLFGMLVLNFLILE